jgi:hypothetical protein
LLDFGQLSGLIKKVGSKRSVKLEEVHQNLQIILRVEVLLVNTLHTLQPLVDFDAVRVTQIKKLIQFGAKLCQNSVSKPSKTVAKVAYLLISVWLFVGRYILFGLNLVV